MKFYIKSKYFLIRLNNRENADRNIFINNQLILYRWIEFKHLEIKFDKHILKDSLNNFNRLSLYKTPTEKINCYMTHIKFLYKEIGIEKGTEDILPILIYSIIKSNINNIYIEKIFMDYYKRKNFNHCQYECTHLNNNFLKKIELTEICDCLNYCIYDYNETTYYLTLLDTAISFIERIEFKSLKITREEYDDYINQHVILLRTTNKESDAELPNNNKISKIIKYFRRQK